MTACLGGIVWLRILMKKQDKKMAGEDRPSV
jgi:hypothetical protein